MIAMPIPEEDTKQEELWLAIKRAIGNRKMTGIVIGRQNVLTIVADVRLQVTLSKKVSSKKLRWFHVKSVPHILHLIIDIYLVYRTTRSESYQSTQNWRWIHCGSKEPLWALESCPHKDEEKATRLPPVFTSIQKGSPLSPWEKGRSWRFLLVGSTVARHFFKNSSRVFCCCAAKGESHKVRWSLTRFDIISQGSIESHKVR
jgi:hypothetical protein